MTKMTPESRAKNPERAAVWDEWNALGDDCPAPVKTIAQRLNMATKDVASIVYPADWRGPNGETFGAWADDQEPDLARARNRAAARKGARHPLRTNQLRYSMIRTKGYAESLLHVRSYIGNPRVDSPRALDLMYALARGLAIEAEYIYGAISDLKQSEDPGYICADCQAQFAAHKESGAAPVALTLAGAEVSN